MIGVRSVKLRTHCKTLGLFSLHTSSKCFRLFLVGVDFWSSNIFRHAYTFEYDTLMKNVNNNNNKTRLIWIIVNRNLKRYKNSNDQKDIMLIFKWRLVIIISFWIYRESDLVISWDKTEYGHTTKRKNSCKHEMLVFHGNIIFKSTILSLKICIVQSLQVYFL